MKRFVLLAAIVLAVAVAVVLVLRREEAVAPSPAARSGTGEIGRGEYLALIGDCLACHTVRGGRPYAGGLPMPTPFGTLYTPNITPDKETASATTAPRISAARCTKASRRMVRTSTRPSPSTTTRG